ncbi:MAG: queuosine precursor transporter [Phycisphaeraceae bacterium]|nr:queuosine precursor transporter [Phycisphaeraceae bacterium]
MSQPAIEPAVLHARRERVFLVLAGLFLGTLAMLNILGISRFICLASWGPLPPEVGAGGDWVWNWGKPNFISNVNFALAVGVLPYPLTFLCTDIISEFYGRKRANFVVLVGLLLNMWVMFVLWAGGALPGFDALDPVTHMPPQPQWDPGVQAFRETGWTFFQVRNLAFGAVTASMIAYLAAQFCDVYVFHFWKRVTRGKHLWLRNNGSTMVSQMVDTFAVITITHFYAHALPLNLDHPIWPQLWLFIGTSYAFKFTAALLDTPFFYGAVYLLKDYLQIDPTVEHSADQEEAVMDYRPQ